MLDYANFNRQHTPYAQFCVFNSFAKYGARHNYHADWVQANEWVAAAKYNMLFTLPHDHKKHKVKQGLFSGTRSTDLLNTVLNIAYFRLACKYVSAQYGLQPRALYNVHQGDDVWTSNTNKLWSRVLYYTMNSMGFVFQEKKQMFGNGAGEYLRVMYRQGKAYGYTQRCLVNYTLRQVQDDMVEDLHAAAGGYCSSLQLQHKISRRFRI